MENTAFTNDPVGSEALPQYETVPLSPVHPSYWYVILVNVIVVTVLVGAAGLTILWRVPDPGIAGWAVLGLWLLFMLAQLVARRLAFRRRSYAIRERDVIYRRGVLGVVTTIVPFNRIQHVSINEGLLSRWLGLAQLQVFTAGGSAANMVISGLPKDEAERIKAYIMSNVYLSGSSVAKPGQTESSHE